MNATNRRLAIFDKLLNEKRVVVMNLAEEFNVTPMTIRRDLSVLEKQGVAAAIDICHGKSQFK